MKHTIAIAALAGIATGAHAQTSGTVSFNAPDEVQPGERFLVEVIGSGNQSGILSFNLAVTVTGPAAVVGMPAGNPDLWVFNTFDGVGSFEAYGSDNPFALEQLANGSVLFTFELSVVGAGPVRISASPATIVSGGAGTLTYPVDGFTGFVGWDFDRITFEDALIRSIPAPSALTPLSLAGLVAARRRRRTA